ncbi:MULTISPECIES: stage V sporulation protein AD [unclassified Clostridium]|uniref:stage V sporulation protein AD n=1 Tax=unclassified Clostridium TaxID=2614128 RepID=UPI000E541890|nr:MULTISPECIES: stage V sporulation protein AD [unclassified Clostridium]RHP48564.1 stage V sporulation protein AD [Clostridium sp. AF32-12BH]RHV63816.1 stage V sporulation protein AD [Clostridium sp. OM02-18AC]
MQMGKASLRFEHPAFVASWASVAGKKEGQGPLAAGIDVTEQDEMFGMENWEQAESAMQKQAADLALEKGNIHRREVRYLFAGDLLGQLIATSFGTVDLEIPLFGLYGACSTMGEAMGLGAMCVNAGYADRVLAIASSHFATAEKQFRFPLGYGNQRAQSASWTVTGCGAVVLECGKKAGNLPTSHIAVTGITTGKLVDMGTRDSMNMGAAMAPAAWNTICQNLEDFGVDVSYYDRIITGDLGAVGQKVLLDFMKSSGHDMAGRHMDCGLEIYDRGEQDVHAGGSGCGCAAVTLCAHILPKMQRGEWKRVLFVPTGALLSTVSYNEGESIPGIAHAVVLERMEV